MKKAIVDILSNTSELIDMTQDEVIEYEEYKVKADSEVSTVTAKQEENAAAKQLILGRLGITEEEARLLLS